MNDKSGRIRIEMFYTLTCPNCKLFKRMLTEVLPEYADKFEFKTTLASAPLGMIRSMKLGIHTVPTLLIDNTIVFREVPARQELINKLNMY
ncbi:MAG: thioredoxin family protein [Bacteroidales bacterium]